MLAGTGLAVASIAGASLAPAPGSPFAVGTNPRVVGVGDFNRDGLMDMVTANGGSQNISVLLGDGHGGFSGAAGSPFSAGQPPETLAVGDLNNDGNLDVVTTHKAAAVGQSGTASVLLGNGHGGLSAPSSCANPFGVSFRPSAVAIGNFNQDGNPDLAIPNAFLNDVEIYGGNGAGCFTRTATFALGGTNPHAIAVADFNKDGHADLAVANQDSQNVSLLLGDGAGGFAPATGSPFALGRFGDGLAVGDFNEDGHLDLAVSNFTFFSISVLLGDGAGGFAPAAGSPFSTNAASNIDAVTVAAGDFNADGHLDLATAGTNQNKVAVLFGAGNGGFTQAAGSPFAVGDLPEWVASADFDRDGSDDLAVANTGSSNVSVLLGSNPPPVTTVKLDPAAPDGSNGWYRTAVGVAVTASDPGGAVAQTRCVLDPAVPPTTFGDLPDAACALSGVTADGSHAIYAASIDTQGSAEHPLVEADVKLDATPPTVSPSFSADPILLGQTSVTALANAADTTSGIATSGCGTVDTAVAGDHVVSCTATDNASNSSSVDVHYLVEYRILGFLNPTSGAGIKAGKTVPVKAALGDILGSRLPDSEAAQLATGCRVKFSAAGAQPVASQCMKYDAAAHQFVFNWRLAKSGAGQETISVTVTYPGTSSTSQLQEQIMITT